MRAKLILAANCALLAVGILAAGALVAAEPQPAYTNSLGMEFMPIPAGSFVMGADQNLAEADDNEKPPHRVIISRPFFLGRYEVTQGQWLAVMGGNPSNFRGWDNPVERVSFSDVQIFIRRLNEKEGTDKYRLPTEAEWEYAARAGSAGHWFFGDDPGELGEYAWYLDNAGEKTHPVGRKRPNPWGLYDMYGNVLEWAQDWYGERYYAESPEKDPAGPPVGSFHVFRGGCWIFPAWFARSAFRMVFMPGERYDIMGFRLALSSLPEKLKKYTNGLGMEFVLVPAGSFAMGAAARAEKPAETDETPVHPVRISRPFFLGRHEVTQKQWEAVMGYNPSSFKGPEHPVEGVSWPEVQDFIQKLNQKEGSDKYRLPTEAEWEYAARAGSGETWPETPGELARYAWYGEDAASGSSHPVGRKQPNAWGFYDMAGNVWEWVADWYGEGYYAASPPADPPGPPSGLGRVFRGGGWNISARYCRPAYRSGGAPTGRFANLGFRLALEPGP